MAHPDIDVATEKTPRGTSHDNGDTTSLEDGGSLKPLVDMTRRTLKPRHIQLIGMGGTIGTALYVQIGKSLMNGGPGSLFIAFTCWYVLPRLYLGPWFHGSEFFFLFFSLYSGLFFSGCAMVWPYDIPFSAGVGALRIFWCRLISTQVGALSACQTQRI